MDQVLLDRYIYAVISKLPKEQREDIKLELESLISDMCEEGRKLEDVLLTLGNPDDLANKYREKEKYLIGPEYYDLYIWLVKIVLFATTISAAVSSIATILTSTLENHSEIISLSISSFVMYFNLVHPMFMFFPFFS